MEPQRTCLGCRQVAGKGELVRLVRDRRGVVVVDERACLPGRGAYVHRRRACVENAIRTKAFARSFRGRILSDPGRNDFERLWDSLDGISHERPVGPDSK